MRILRSVCAAWCLCLVLVLCGCGASSTGTVTPPVQTPPVQTQPNAAALAGNWLLMGSLPLAPVFSVGASQPKGIAVSIDVIGSTLLGTASLQGQCSNGVAYSGIYGAVLQGTVAKDGTFTLGTPTGFSAGFSIGGTVPTASNGAWSGTYTISATTPLCPRSDSGTFQAVAIHDVTGRYSGSTASLTGGGTVTVTADLQQGGPLLGPGGAVGSYSRLALGGTVTVTGIPCFTKGTMSTGLVEGATAFMVFTMDDGSTMNLTGYIQDTDAARLSTSVLLVQGGKCSGGFSNPFSPLVLQR